MKAENRYKLKSYDRIEIIVYKGAKADLKALADAAGVSLNGYILRALEQYSGQRLTLENTLPQIAAARARAAEQAREQDGPKK